MSGSARVHRYLLGTSSPMLPRAADWLLDELAGGSADLGDALVAVPGGRAQRRLMELLAERSAGTALIPPTIVTLGGLAARLMPEGQTPIASSLESLLAWARVLREADRAVLDRVVSHAPARDDWPGWWALARQVTQATAELGAQLLLMQDVAEHVGHVSDLDRWEALAELDRRYHAALAARGRVDLHAARRRAIQDGGCDYPGPVVLIATADLQPVHKQMLAGLASPIHALVFADEENRAGFDALGGLIGTYWAGRRIGIADDALRFVEGPAEQAGAVFDAIADWSEAEATGADAITIGLGDAALSGPIRRVLGLAGLPARSAVGRPIAASRPVLLLQALGAFADGLRFDALAALLRHPDAEAHVIRTAGRSPRPWLTLLDQYATDHLAAKPVGGWLGDEQQVQAMEAVYRAAAALLPNHAQAPRPLSSWSASIGEALAQVYGSRRLHRHRQEDRPIVAALEAVGRELEQLAALEPSAVPDCSFTQALSLVLAQLAGQSIPEPGGEPAIELVGFLELLLDDAPCLALAGLNEQHVPEPPRHSALLPEGVRRELGLPSDAHRLARDGYALQTMLACRAPHRVRLIAARRSGEGDPLLPSRLLLACEDRALVGRISDFVAEQGESTMPAPMLLTPGRHDRFLIPRPVMPDQPITALRVTAFRDYLACPYRFYLKHVLKLRTLDDRAAELSAAGFGTLAHETLCTLAGPELQGCDKPETIAERLSRALDRTFTKQYGGDPPVAARVQMEQLRYRLDAFAPVQAALARDGWRITTKEQAFSVPILVDGEPFTITGQIDRIDQRGHGRYRLIDYKTSDSAKRPDQTHRKTVEGQRAWIDLQLPLYLDLSAQYGVPPSAELGYINLPKKRADTAYAPAGWSAQELETARHQRDWVIRRVRDGVFWPPKLPPVFDDGMGGLCADAVPDRSELVRRSAATTEGGRDG